VTPDKLRRLGREPIGIAFSGRAADPRYDNKRTEMYFEAVDWIRRGGALPPGPASQELIAALSRTTYSFRGDRLLLEPKDQVKARLGYSPDDADAFVLTFAQPVAGRERFYDPTMEWEAMRRRSRPGRVIVDYDPLA
jgi:phage terminase large subunit